MNVPSRPPIYPLSLHDALPISEIRLRQRVSRHRVWRRRLESGRIEPFVQRLPARQDPALETVGATVGIRKVEQLDRKSTRLNSSHTVISYAVFCLKKKKPTRAC